MSEPTYELIENLAGLLPEIPAESIVSRKVYSDDLLKVTLFGSLCGFVDYVLTVLEEELLEEFTEHFYLLDTARIKS